MLMRIPILLPLLLVLTSCKFCTQPQRGGTLSFKALSSRDHITKLFYLLDSKTSIYNTTTTNNSITYNLTNLKPQFYYLDDSERNEFVDSNTAKVTSGKLYLAAAFNYSYGITGTSVTKGYAITKVLLDPFTFLKQLLTDKGYLEWNPTEVEDIVMSALFVIEESTPTMPNSTRRLFENMLNDHLETPNNMKANILTQLNTLFKAELKTQLNSQNIINTNNLTYTYKGTNVTYVNQVYYLSLYNDDEFKGLKYFYLFQLQNYTKNCNILPMNPDPSFGGVQQIISMETFRSTFSFGLQKGLFNIELDSKWDSSIFQFYVGDVANVIDQLSRTNPSTPVTGECHYDSAVGNSSVTYQSMGSIVASIPYRCSLKINNSTLIQSITFTASFDVNFYAQNNTLKAVNDGAFLSTVKFYPEGGYTVTDTAVGAYYILSVLRTTDGKQTFGTGFPTLFRKYPILKVTPNYTVIYDPSEM